MIHGLMTMYHMLKYVISSNSTGLKVHWNEFLKMSDHQHERLAMVKITLKEFKNF